MVWESDHKRREFLKLAAFSLAGLTTTGARGLGQAQRDVTQRPETPERALSLLVEGNQRFVAQNLLSFQEDLDILKAHSEEHQEPFAAVLSCADSRVPVELVFDQSIGHLFVVRVAGNVATPDTIASLEYGAAVLGVKAILALGHTNCGAVKATIAGKAVPGQISTLYQFIHPAIAGAKGDLTTACRQNARLQASVLSETSPVLAELVKEKKLAIRAAMYDVGNGKVTMIEA
jgi:carbonic anhydrase